MKAVIDTSVYVSLLLAGRGTGAWLIALWKEHRFEIVVSPALLEELLEVLDRPAIQRRVDHQRRLALFRLLRGNALWVEGILKSETGLNDPGDDFLLSAALESEAEFIVTWDNALLQQKVCQGVRLINPEQFTSLIVRMTK
jgi:putative PIN family toxin of toxin-antitoxin system